MFVNMRTRKKKKFWCECSVAYPFQVEMIPGPRVVPLRVSGCVCFSILVYLQCFSVWIGEENKYKPCMLVSYYGSSGFGG